MTQEFPLLSAALGQSLESGPAGDDVGRVLDVLGIAGTEYHSFEPPEPPEPSRPAITAPPPTSAPLRVPTPAPTMALSDLETETPPRPSIPSAPVSTPQTKAALRMPQPRAALPAEMPAAPAPPPMAQDHAVPAYPASKRGMSIRDMYRALGGLPAAAGTPIRSLRDVFSAQDGSRTPRRPGADR